MKLIFLGPPGVGKGTQATILAEKLSVPHISTGEMLRAQVAAGSELGLKVKSVLDAGALVSDDLMLEVVKDRLSASDCEKGFILDGFPRTLPQAEALSSLFKEQSLEFDGACLFSVDEKAIAERMASRRAEENRSDDSPEVQAKRIAVYNEQTAPLVDFYRDLSKLIEVNAEGDIDSVTKKLFSALNLS